MIVYPVNWEQCTKEIKAKEHAGNLVGILYDILININIRHLSLSGGIDSTLMLALLTSIFGSGIHTYIISCREDHPDVLFARLAAETFKSIHTEIIVEPDTLQEDEEFGDNAVRQFYEVVVKHTDKIIACDGIDELACGYYGHHEEGAYQYYLDALVDTHLVPLSKNSGNVRVFLPFLDRVIIEYLRGIPLDIKLENNTRKAIVVEAAKLLNVPEPIVQRNKYGFCDAFREEDK